jgi:hypothetical protein
VACGSAASPKGPCRAGDRCVPVSRVIAALRALLALAGHHLHERDPRSIVDADMDDLPTNAVVTVDRAGISPGDAVTYRANPTELLDIEVDQFTGVLAFIASNRFGRLQVV